MKPLICFDLDGTLIDADGSIHPRDICLMSGSDMDAIFIPATGRPLESVRTVFNKNGLFVDQLVPFPMVLLNGALSLRPREVVSCYRPFDQSVLKQLLDLTRSFRDITFWFLSAEHADIQWPSEYASQEARKFDLVTRPLLPDGDRVLYAKVMCVSQSRARLMKIKETVGQWPVEAAFSMEGLFEITPAGVNKCSGLKDIIHDLEMEGAPTYAAGNGDNDLEMFRLAKLSFAPLTSPEHVRDAANRLIDVRSDGLLMPMLEQIGISPKGCAAR